MTEFEMMVAMIERTKPICGYIIDKKQHTIELCCDDDWYTRIFKFNKQGKLIEVI